MPKGVALNKIIIYMLEDKLMSKLFSFYLFKIQDLQWKHPIQQYIFF